MCKPARRNALERALQFALEPLETRALLAGSIAGTAFTDVNGNAALDSGEQTLNGITVFLDFNNSGELDAGEASAVTSGGGNYSFTGLVDGTYKICESIPSTSILTTGASLSATIVGGNTVGGKNFGNFPTQFVGTNGSDNWTLRIDASNPSRLLIIQQLLGQPQATFGVTKSLLPSVNIFGSAGDDTFHADYSNGNPIPSGGLNIDAASASTSAGDRVTVTGSNAADSVTIFNSDFMIGGGSIAIKEIEKITVNGNLGDDQIVLGRTLNAAVVVDAGGGQDTLTFNGTDSIDFIAIGATTISDGSFAPSLSAVECLVVAAQDAADSISLTGSLASMSVIVQGGDGSDTLTIAAAPLSNVSFHGGLAPTDHDALNLNAGSLTFSNDAATVTSNLTLNVADAASVNFGATQHLESLNISGQAKLLPGGNRVLLTRALSISGAGKLDLTDNDLVVDYSANSPLGTWNGANYTGISGMLSSGFNGGGWDGNGLQTSAATSTTTLGVAEASWVLGISTGQTALFGGVVVDSTSVLVKYTYGGDANLSGHIDVDDYGLIDFNASTNGGLTGYFNGDFDLNGVLDIDDYGIIDFVVNIQGPPL